MKRVFIAAAMLVAGYFMIGIVVTNSSPPAWKDGNEVMAIQALARITSAQALYVRAPQQSGAKSYGDMTALERSGLLKSAFSSVRGYLITVSPSRERPGERWYGFAVPRTPSDGDRGFFVNQQGIIYFRWLYSQKPPAVDADRCIVPDGFEPLPN